MSSTIDEKDPGKGSAAVLDKASTPKHPTAQPSPREPGASGTPSAGESAKGEGSADVKAAAAPIQTQTSAGAKACTATSGDKPAPSDLPPQAKKACVGAGAHASPAVVKPAANMASDPATPSASVKGPEASKGKAPSVTAAWAGASNSTVPSSPFTFELKPSMLSAPRATSLASPSRPIKTAPVAVDKASSPAKPMANVDKQPASRPKSTTGADKQAMTIAGKQATSAGPVDRDEGVEFINHIWPTPETLISFADLPTPDRAYPVPQGCHRYEFTSFGAQGREERRAAERTFLQQIKKQAAEHGVDVDHLSFTFPMISGPDRVVDVFYRSLEAWTKARRFTLVYDSVPLQLVASCRPLGRGTTVLTLRDLPPTTDLPSFLQSFQSGLGPYLTLNDIWADCLRRADGTVAFRGTFTILATFRGHHGPFSLPGWLQYRGFDHRLGFLGRPNLCSQCRLERDPHTIDACTWQTCPHCGGRGHKRLDCDSHPLAIQAKKFYDSFYGM